MLGAVAVTRGAPSRTFDDALRREGHDAIPPTEAVPPAASAVHAVCPFLVMADGSWRSAAGLRDQRCGAIAPAAPLTIEKQRRLCVTAEHLGCSTFIAADRHGTEAQAVSALRGRAAGPTRWALARTSALVLEDGAPLPLAMPTAYDHLGEDPAAGRSSAPSTGRTEPIGPGGAFRWRSGAELAARLEIYADRATTGASSWSDRVASALERLIERGRRLPVTVRIDPADKARRTSRPPLAPWWPMAGLRSRLNVGRRATRATGSEGRAGSLQPRSRIGVPPVAAPRRSLPLLRLSSIAAQRLASARDTVRAVRARGPALPAPSIRSMPPGAPLRDARRGPRAAIGTLRVSGARPASSTRRLGTGMRLGGVVAAAMAVAVAAGLAASRPSPPPAGAPVVAGSATGAVLGEPPRATLGPRSAPAAGLATPSQPRSSPTADATSTPRETYTVAAGDTLFEIARRFDTTIEALQRLNRLESADVIEVGQVLELP